MEAAQRACTTSGRPSGRPFMNTSHRSILLFAVLFSSFAALPACAVDAEEEEDFDESEEALSGSVDAATCLQANTAAKLGTDRVNVRAIAAGADIGDIPA